ncbi:MAG TPA: hypothetical protein VFP85_13595 [Vicinamibacterales bacterium]|nr:hypothetical protein [Vicinamibacterales bacterium]
MSPILTRPVREQLEHDRVIRQLQLKYKRKTDVIINPGNEQNQSVTVGDLVVFPDLLVFVEGSRRLLVTVEVETGESVNAIEARAEWGVYSKLKVPLHLYVPTVCVDAARRICDEYQILVSELWSFATAFDQVRFTLVHKSPDAPTVRIPAAAPERSRPAKPAAKASPKPAAKAKLKPKAKTKPAARPAAKKAAKKAKPAPRKGAKKRR